MFKHKIGTNQRLPFLKGFTEESASARVISLNSVKVINQVKCIQHREYFEGVSITYDYTTPCSNDNRASEHKPYNIITFIFGKVDAIFKINNHTKEMH